MSIREKWRESENFDAWTSSFLPGRMTEVTQVPDGWSVPYGVALIRPPRGRKYFGHWDGYLLLPGDSVSAAVGLQPGEDPVVILHDLAYRVICQSRIFCDWRAILWRDALHMILKASGKNYYPWIGRLQRRWVQRRTKRRCHAR